jgi:uroporphyrinogen III methyltransferase/synthase
MHAQEPTSAASSAARPLHGQTIVVTRPRQQADAMGARLVALGARVLYQPAIEIRPPASWDAVDRAIARLHDYDWIVFSSSNGVSHFLGRLGTLRRDAHALSRIQLAVVGPGTAEELTKYGLQANLVPAEHRAEALADAIAAEAHLPQRRVEEAGWADDSEASSDSATGASEIGREKMPRFLLVRANRGREVLAERLVAAGGIVDQVVAYESHDVVQLTPEVAQAAAENQIDWITVTSSAIARALASLFGPALGRARVASISPITTETLKGLGIAMDAEASDYTSDGLIDAILRAER